MSKMKKWDNVKTGYKEKKFFKFLKDKNVAMVGPSSSLFKKEQGEIINSFDIIVRLNIGFPVPDDAKIDVGNRTDILYISRYDHHEWDNTEIRWLIFTLNKKNRAKTIVPIMANYSLPWLVLSSSFMNSISTNIKSLPNTGLVAIIHLLQSSIKNLTLFGMDFYQNEYHPNLSYEEKNYPIACKNNDMLSQILYLSKICEEDSRLVVSKELKEIFKNL